MYQYSDTSASAQRYWQVSYRITTGLLVHDQDYVADLIIRTRSYVRIMDLTLTLRRDTGAPTKIMRILAHNRDPSRSILP